MPRLTQQLLPLLHRRISFHADLVESE